MERLAYSVRASATSATSSRRIVNRSVGILGTMRHLALNLNLMSSPATPRSHGVRGLETTKAARFEQRALNAFCYLGITEAAEGRVLIPCDVVDVDLVLY